MKHPTNSTLSPTFAVFATCANSAATLQLRHRTPHVPTRWPTPRLPLWQSDRPAPDRPIGTSPEDRQAEARGNSRQASQSLFRWSERNWS